MTLETEIRREVEDLISVREAAELMGVSEATMYRNIRSGIWDFGVIRPTRRSRRWHISKARLLVWVRSLRGAEGDSDGPKEL